MLIHTPLSELITMELQRIAQKQITNVINNLHPAKSYNSHGGVCTAVDSASNNVEWNQQIMTVKEEFNTHSLSNTTDHLIN